MGIKSHVRQASVSLYRMTVQMLFRQSSSWLWKKIFPEIFQELHSTKTTCYKFYRQIHQLWYGKSGQAWSLSLVRNDKVEKCWKDASSWHSSVYHMTIWWGCQRLHGEMYHDADAVPNHATLALFFLNKKQRCCPANTILLFLESASHQSPLQHCFGSIEDT